VRFAIVRELAVLIADELMQPNLSIGQLEQLLGERRNVLRGRFDSDLKLGKLVVEVDDARLVAVVEQVEPKELLGWRQLSEPRVAPLLGFVESLAGGLFVL
jgi:hypothetical protein